MANSNPFIDRFFTLGSLLGQGAKGRQQEGDFTKLLRNMYGNAAENATKNYNSNTDSSDPMLQEEAKQRDFKTRINNILNPNQNYNASGDLNASSNAKDYNDIAAAKLEYELARDQNDIDGMNAAHSKAEAVRQRNPNLASFAASADASGYLDYLDKRKSFDKAQSLNNFVNGTGQYDFSNPNDKTAADFVNGTGAYAKVANPYQFTTKELNGNNQNMLIGDGLNNIASGNNVATLGGNPPVAMATPGVAAADNTVDTNYPFTMDALKKNNNQQWKLPQMMFR